MKDTGLMRPESTTPESCSRRPSPPPRQLLPHPVVSNNTMTDTAVVKRELLALALPRGQEIFAELAFANAPPLILFFALASVNSDIGTVRTLEHSTHDYVPYDALFWIQPVQAGRCLQYFSVLTAPAADAQAYGGEYHVGLRGCSATMRTCAPILSGDLLLILMCCDIENSRVGPVKRSAVRGKFLFVVALVLCVGISSDGRVERRG